LVEPDRIHLLVEHGREHDRPQVDKTQQFLLVETGRQHGYEKHYEHDRRQGGYIWGYLGPVVLLVEREKHCEHDA
jgi:hypothetical protein